VPESAWVKWQEVIKILGMTFVATCIVNSRKRLEHLVWVVALSIGFYGIKGGIFALLTGGQYRLWGPPDSFIGDNNALALALIMTLPLLHFLALTAKDRRLRFGLWAAMGLTTLATLCTYSRGGFLALGITATAFWLKTRHRLLTGIAVVALLGSSLAFLPESWYERMDTIVHYQQDTSANERLTVWRYAIRLAGDHPLVGGGFNVVEICEATTKAKTAAGRHN